MVSSLRSHGLFLILLLACVGLATPGHAQPTQSAEASPSLARNNIYFELGGSGLLYSLNYSRRIGTRTVGRIGGTWFPFARDIPASVSGLSRTGTWRPKFGVEWAF